MVLLAARSRGKREEELGSFGRGKVTSKGAETRSLHCWQKGGKWSKHFFSIRGNDKKLCAKIPPWKIGALATIAGGFNRGRLEEKKERYEGSVFGGNKENLAEMPDGEKSWGIRYISPEKVAQYFWGYDIFALFGGIPRQKKSRILLSPSRLKAREKIRMPNYITKSIAQVIHIISFLQSYSSKMKVLCYLQYIVWGGSFLPPLFLEKKGRFLEKSR